MAGFTELTHDPETRYRAIVEAAVDAIFVIDEQGMVQAANPACRVMLGWNPEELIGGNISRIMPSPYRDEHDHYLARYLQSGERRIIGIGREVQGLHRDGRRIPLWLSVSEIVEDGRPLFTGILRDLSQVREADLARRASEERLRSVVETAGVAILVLSTDHRVLEWNPEAERIYGWSRDEILQRDYVETCLPPEERERVAAEIARVIAGGESRGFENQVVCRDGRRHAMLWNARWLPDADGAPAGLVACGQDISEYKALQSRAAQEHALAQLGEMAAIVAHEVKNPLAAVSQVLQVLRDRFSRGTEEERLIGDLVERVGALDRLVRDLLTYARPRAPRPARVPVELLLESAAKVVQDDPQFAGVEVVLGGEAAVIEVDPELLQPVLANALLNAAQAIDGQGRIEARVALEPGLCRIEIADPGPGIPEELREKVFEPFYTTKTRGTGLGLPISRRIVEAHGGTIGFEAAAGGGSLLVIRLPL